MRHPRSLPTRLRIRRACWVVRAVRLAMRRLPCATRTPPTARPLFTVTARPRPPAPAARPRSQLLPTHAYTCTDALLPPQSLFLPPLL